MSKVKTSPKIRALSDQLAAAGARLLAAARASKADQRKLRADTKARRSTTASKRAAAESHAQFAAALKAEQRLYRRVRALLDRMISDIEQIATVKAAGVSP